MGKPEAECRLSPPGCIRHDPQPLLGDSFELRLREKYGFGFWGECLTPFLKFHMVVQIHHPDPSGGSHPSQSSFKQSTSFKQSDKQMAPNAGMDLGNEDLHLLSVWLQSDAATVGISAGALKKLKIFFQTEVLTAFILGVAGWPRPRLDAGLPQLSIKLDSFIHHTCMWNGSTAAGRAWLVQNAWRVFRSSQKEDGCCGLCHFRAWVIISPGWISWSLETEWGVSSVVTLSIWLSTCSQSM